QFDQCSMDEKAHYANLARQSWNARAELIIRSRLEKDENSLTDERNERVYEMRRVGFDIPTPLTIELTGIDGTVPDQILPCKKMRKSGGKTSVEEKKSVNSQSNQQREEADLEREYLRFVYKDNSQ
ncbi:hypothetical protein PENTCL1PPCAC_30305, partial [Pristionchus entomophagus]